MMMFYCLYSQLRWLIKTLSIKPATLVSALVGWGFIWVSAITIRSVPYQVNAILQSTTTQASLTIVWCVSSLIIVAISTWYHNKTIWWVGIVILAMTICKLFFVDLANSNTIARIISFIGVGLVLLLIGYFSPVFGNKNDK